MPWSLNLLTSVVGSSTAVILSPRSIASVFLRLSCAAWRSFSALITLTSLAATSDSAWVTATGGRTPTSTCILFLSLRSTARSRAVLSRSRFFLAATTSQYLLSTSRSTCDILFSSSFREIVLDLLAVTMNALFTPVPKFRRSSCPMLKLTLLNQFGLRSSRGEFVSVLVVETLKRL